jgi:hypothetical protein
MNLGFTKLSNFFCSEPNINSDTDIYLDCLGLDLENIRKLFHSKTFLFSLFVVIIIIATLIIFFVFAFIVFVVCSYFLYKYLQVNIDNNYVYFYDYNDTIKQLLEKYGDYKINKVYLIREPVTKLVYYFIDILTFYRYKNQYMFPYHTSLVCEINLPNNIKKYIMIEKNNCININENYNINEKQDIKCIDLFRKKSGPKNRDKKRDKKRDANKTDNQSKLTLNDILKMTQERIGNDKFFNWHIYKNNCQLFTKELLITLGHFTAENEFYIFQDELLKTVYFSETTIHVLNCIINTYNVIQKYMRLYLYSV